MIETIIRNYLLPLGVPVYIDVPADPPDEFITIERTGGGMDEHIRSAMIAVQSYGASHLRAAEIHEDVLARMGTLAELDEVSACAVNAEYNYTDSGTKRYRYQAVFDIIYY